MFQILKTLLNHGEPSGTTPDEAELLRLLRGTQREAVFQTIVTRYGALVWSVCRRQQLRVSDAEDVFQATFLVLLEQAHTIRQASLSSWLYGVAWRISAKLKRQQAREQARLQRVATTEAQYACDAMKSEELSKLDEAIQRLPDIYREPVIRCCLLGQSQSSVSQTLGWPLGTVAGRLARAKELLRTRLARQGIAPVALAALGADVQAVPVAVLQPALDLLRSAHSTRVIDMTRWISYSSFPSKLFYISMTAVLLVVGTGWLAYSQATPPQESKASPVTNIPVDLKADRNAMQGAWVRDIHHDITGAKVAVEELVIKNELYERRWYALVSLADEQVTWNLCERVSWQPCILKTVEGTTRRIELINFNNDARRLSKTGLDNANLVERLMGSYEIKGDQLIITFDKKVVYKNDPATSKWVGDIDNPRSIVPEKRIVYRRGPMQIDINGALARLKEGEVAHRLLVDDATFERLMDGDIVMISATNKEKNSTTLVEKRVEVLVKDSSYFLNTGKRSVLLRLTQKQALNLKHYQDKYEIMLSHMLPGDK